MEGSGKSKRARIRPERREAVRRAVLHVMTGEGAASLALDVRDVHPLADEARGATDDLAGGALGPQLVGVLVDQHPRLDGKAALPDYARRSRLVGGNAFLAQQL
eukprot:10349395-Alexandrium_andersonii.AAC.1